ncbi:DegT/DnrJ/EryC1/StrS aminotransferase family protein [Ahrensia sp. R2A130]|uniref:DegT/DnrJ/EryC1/StrS family aminotransferase n=1 Tax=Ahrensia sp. R2A130 TaxID=744979 RepID=UPI0001E08C8B|nr:DegT/DnrJ/EryC1/StrS aminotransferase family protein [Ahrensia sp. R2A130]EFL89120.1 DegT/DnrJ/EryC1/StrS aminotransferase [Ahrensia sp. R2A130]
MLDGPFAPWPNFTAEEADAVSRVLLSNRVNYWTGQEGREFEKEFATFARANHAVALANGTLALDLALHGLGIGSRNGGAESDEVIVTPRSFMASVSCVLNAGARPVFADVDAESQNITFVTVEPHITKQTRAVICVHLAGWPCDMDGLKALADHYDIKLIEDCAQAHGALYKGRPVGGLGDVAAWSFCQDKIMTTGGEGGMVTCNDENIWRRMWAFKDHGKSYEAVYERDHAPGFRWLHESVGTNWRMTEMQAVIGRIQLKRMPCWTLQRGANADALAETLAPWSGPDGFLHLPDFNAEAAQGSRHANYKFYAFVRPDHLPDGATRDAVIAEIVAQGLPCMQGSCSEIYLEKAFDGLDLRPAHPLPIAKRLGETSLMFVCHPGVHKVDIDLSKGGELAAA